MMKTFTFGPYHQVRFWTDELPDVHFAAHPCTDVRLGPGGEPFITEPRVAAIEARKIVGPRAMYGLLAAKCEPVPRGAPGMLTVCAAEPLQSECLSWAMGNSTDPVTPGIFPEFAAAILQGASKVDELRGVGPVRIQFFGAKAEMSSAPETFMHLGEALTRLVVGVQWPPLVTDSFFRTAVP